MTNVPDFDTATFKGTLIVNLQNTETHVHKITNVPVFIQ